MVEGQYCEAISVLAGCVVLAFQFLFNSNTCYEDDTVSHVILVWRVRVTKHGWPHRAGTTHAVQSTAPFLTYHQFLRILRWPSGDSAIALHCLLRFTPVLPLCTHRAVRHILTSHCQVQLILLTLHASPQPSHELPSCRCSIIHKAIPCWANL